MGVTAVAGGMHFSYASKGKSCALLLYKKEGTAPLARILFPDGLRTGDVWNVTVLGDFEGLFYTYEVDGKETPDPYGRQFTGMEHWGSLGRLGGPVRCLCPAPGRYMTGKGTRCPGYHMNNA